MNMTRDKIEELKRLAEHATQGEWTFFGKQNEIQIKDNVGCLLARMSWHHSNRYDYTLQEESVANAKFIAAANPQTILSLLDLAERALEPQESHYAALGRIAMRFVDRAGDVHPGIDDAEHICREFHEAMSDAIDARFEGRALEPQGQALPELPKPAGWARWVDRRLEFSVGAEKPFCNERGSGYFTPWAMMFDGKTTQDYGKQCLDAGRASQLALPAGAVPTDDEIWEAVEYITELHGYDIRDEHDDMWTKALVISVVRHLQDSPAVAQPVADEREASDAYFKARHPMLDTTANRNVFSAGFRAAFGQPVEEGDKA